MFDYAPEKTNCTLSQDVLTLLETIDAFPYPILNPAFKTLGDLHHQLAEVRVTDHIPDRLHSVWMPISEIKKLRDRWKAHNEAIRKHNEIINERISKCDNQEQRELLYGQLKSEADYKPTWILEDILRENANEPEDKLAEVKVIVSVNGFYTRTKGVTPKGQVVLKYTTDKYAIVVTYLHEMMHAFYDSVDLTTAMNNAEYAEEPLAEYGMLHFVQEFVKANPDESALMRYALQHVKSKQQSLGLVHYGFGAYLFENFQHVDWENLMCDAHSKIDTAGALYADLKAVLESIFPESTYLPKVAEDLEDVLLAANDKPFVAITPKRITLLKTMSTSGSTLLMTFKVAGLAYPDDGGVPRAHDIRCLSVFDELLLQREAGNPFDSNAVKLFRLDGRELGFIPKDQNAVPASMLDSGMADRLTAIITDLQPEGSYRDRFVTVQIWIA